MEKEEILTLGIEELYGRSEKYMQVLCGLDRGTRRSEKIKENAYRVREKVFDGLTIDFLIKKFSVDCLRKGSFIFGENVIGCGYLNKISLESVQEGYLFIFHSPMPDLSSLPISEVFFADSWETCFVDAGRDVLREILLERSVLANEKKLYITESLAPGMAGIPGTSVKDFFTIMQPNKVGMELLPSGMMNPVKSFIGIYLLLDQEAVISTMNCRECLSNHKNCEFCQNYARRTIGND